MASWFDSAAQSIGNFVTGHGFEDNSQRSIIDAQNEKKKREEQQAIINKPIIQQRTIPQPKIPNNSLAAPSINDMSGQPLNHPIIQQTVQTPQTVTTPAVNNVAEKMRNTGTAIPYAPEVINVIKNNPNNYNGYNVGGLSNENRALAERTINNSKPGSNIVPVISSLKGSQDVKTSSDYQNSIIGKILSTAGQIPRVLAGGALDTVNFLSRIPQAIQTGANVLKVNTIDNLPGMEQQKARDIAQGALISNMYDKFQKTASGVTNAVGGMNLSSSDETNRQAEAISTGKGTFQDFVGAGLSSINAAMALIGGSKWAAKKVDSSIGKSITSELNAAIQANDTDAFRAAASRFGDDPIVDYLNKIADNQDLINGVKPNSSYTGAPNSTLPSISESTDLTPNIPSVNNSLTVPTNSQVSTRTPSIPQLSLPENTSTTPTINNVLKSDGPNGFVTKTPQQIIDTEKAISGIKKIDTKLNVIRQGKTSSLDTPEVRSLMKQRNDLLSVVTGDKPTQIAPNESQVTNADTTDLGNPGTDPLNGAIKSDPTNADIASIIENTQNPTPPRPPKAKLTPQNEMPDISQKQMDNFTGELGVNKNGQIYRKVSQRANRDAAMKNLLGGKTPEEYLATAAQTGEADSAELAILMKPLPKDSPLWAKLASLKGKLNSQKGQALALIEKTMRETATADQLSSRVLEKAAIAEFDTAKISGPIEQANKEFTDARDAYNALLQTEHTSQELRDAKNAMNLASRKSFIDTEKVLNSAAKNKVQHDLAFEIGKKADLYTPTSAGSSLLSGPPTFIKNTFQGFSSPAYQATTGALEGKINQVIGGSRVGTFDARGFKQGLKQGFGDWKINNTLRSNQLGLTKNPATWVKHPINSIKNIVGAATDFGNVGMEAGAQSGMRSHYTKLLQEQGYTGEKLIKAVDDNVITDPLDLYDTYIKDMNDLNGLTSNSDRNGQLAVFRKSLSNFIGKTGVTDKTANTISDYIEKALIPFVKPAAIIGKKGINLATGGLSDNLIPLIQASRRGDTTAVKNFTSKILATMATATAGGTVIGYGLAKSKVLTQDQYGEWKVGNVPISGYGGAYVVPLAIGALLAQMQDGDTKPEDFGSKFGLTLMNTLPYSDIAQNVGTLAGGISGIVGLAEGKGGQSGYDVQNAISTFGANLAKERIPASAFLNFITKIIGGNVKDTSSDSENPVVNGIESAANKVIAGIPVLGNLNILPDKKNSFGDTIMRSDPISTLLGSTNPSVSESDKATGITAVGSNDLNKVAKTNLTTTEEKDAYNAIVKRLKDNGDSVNDSNVFKEFVKDGNPLLASKYDSSINTSIDDTDKISLAKYNALDSDHQKVYIQNQKNALDVYTAQINNKQANGTLSEDDKKTYKVWSGSGNSLLVKALVAKTNVENNVSRDTLDIYEELGSKKDYNKLSAEQRAAIDKYVSQLSANGVKVPDFLSGDGKSSVKGASNVPLTKAVTSGSNGGGKFTHQDINVEIPQVVKPSPQYVIKQRKISVG